MKKFKDEIKLSGAGNKPKGKKEQKTKQAAKGQNPTKFDAAGYDTDNLFEDDGEDSDDSDAPQVGQKRNRPKSSQDSMNSLSKKYLKK